MQTRQRQWLPVIGWSAAETPDAAWTPDLVFAFGAREVLKDASCLRALRAEFPA